jgi:hypothetical protein
MKNFLLVSVILVISHAAASQEIENFYRFFPITQRNIDVYDSGSYCALLKSFKAEDTIPSTIYNSVALHHLLESKIRPEIIFKQKKIVIKDIGRFSAGVHTEEAKGNQGHKKREILYHKGLYPLLIVRKPSYVNVLILRRDAGYGFIELLSFDLSGKLLSGIFLVEGELGFPLKMIRPKVSSDLSNDGTITQLIEAIDVTVKRIIKQRDDGYFEVIEQEIY